MRRLLAALTLVLLGCSDGGPSVPEASLQELLAMHDGRFLLEAGESLWPPSEDVPTTGTRRYTGLFLIVSDPNSVVEDRPYLGENQETYQPEIKDRPGSWFSAYRDGAKSRTILAKLITDSEQARVLMGSVIVEVDFDARNLIGRAGSFYDLDLTAAEPTGVAIPGELVFSDSVFEGAVFSNAATLGGTLEVDDVARPIADDLHGGFFYPEAARLSLGAEIIVPGIQGGWLVLGVLD